MPEKDLLEVAPSTCLIVPLYQGPQWKYCRNLTSSFTLEGKINEFLSASQPQPEQSLSALVGELSADERVWIVYLVQTLTSSPAAFI